MMELPACYPKQIKISFSEMEDRKDKQVLSGGWYQHDRGGYKEMVKVNECSGSIYLCLKMEK
jgi:hypothetical protein